MYRVLELLTMWNSRFNIKICWKEIGGSMSLNSLNIWNNSMPHLLPHLQGGIQSFIEILSRKPIILSLVPLEGAWFSSKKWRITHKGFIVCLCALRLNEFTLKPNICRSLKYEVRGEHDEFRHRTTHDTYKLLKKT